MIANDEQLKLVQEQLGRIQRALASLRTDIKNDGQFAVLSEGYVDQIAELQAEIDSYEKSVRRDRKAS
jgi:phage host-nuclease inhibitor protein Gam